MSGPYLKELTEFFRHVVNSSIGLGIRYSLLAGLVWLFCYVIFKRRWFHRKIITKFPASKHVRREILFSAISVVIFSVVGVGSFRLLQHGWTRMYFNFDQHGSLWFWASIGCAILLHDTWFYWTHRMMHHRKLFRYFHRTHHLSHNPTPWAAYAFDPAEAVVQALIFPLAIMIIPMHLYAFGIFMMWQIGFNIAGHSGYEINPRWLMKTPLRYILNTPTNHIMHHEKMRGNYGLYFNVWDRLMGTNHADYEARYTEVTSRAGNGDDAVVAKSTGVRNSDPAGPFRNG